MPPKRKPRAAAGRRAARHYLEDNPERQLSAEYVSQRQELIDDLERQGISLLAVCRLKHKALEPYPKCCAVEERKQHIQQLADDAILALKQEHHVLKLSLPDSVPPFRWKSRIIISTVRYSELMLKYDLILFTTWSLSTPGATDCLLFS